MTVSTYEPNSTNERKSKAMKFIDDEHRAFFERQTAKAHVEDDPYRKALFYALGLTEETRRNINSLYDFKENCIDIDGMHKGWQTSTSMKVTRLAFNLYNGFTGTDETSESGNDYTPYSLFSCGLMPYMFEAVKLLYPCYVGAEN